MSEYFFGFRVKRISFWIVFERGDIYNGGIGDKSLKIVQEMKGDIMIDLTGCIALPLLQKSAFTGSYRGMRYRLKKEMLAAAEEEEQKAWIRAVIWPEPYAFSTTPEEQKEWTDFEFSDRGLSEAVEWLNRMYEKKWIKEAGHV